MNLHQLRQRKAELRAASAAIIAAPAGADGLLSDEQRSQFDTNATELDRLQGDEQRMERMAADDHAASGTTLAGKGNGNAVEYRVFADAKATGSAELDSWRTPEGERVPVLTSEQRIADFADGSNSAANEIGLRGVLSALVNGPKNELERRALTEGSASAGGILLPAPMAGGIIDVARTKNVAFQAGARTVPMANKTLRMGKQLTDVVPQWRAENDPIAESDPTFGDVTLDAKNLAVLIKVSREWLEDVPNGDQLLRDSMAAAFARGLDAAIFFGTGTSNAPLGLANTTGLQTVSMGTNGAALTGWAPFLDAALALETVNEGKIDAIVLAPRTNRVIAGLTDTTGQPLQRPPLLANVPILSTTGIPVNETQGTATNASSAFMGDFSQVLVGIRTALQITVLHERFADTGQVGFVGWLRADVAVARPAALAKIVGIKP
ncbi:phage major capsid protein [Sphingobium indicum]|uniref:phage major capsid protein n=1 Tax=Sphingobium indicum TaxID=332055 RepID=UPI0035EACF0F